LAGLKNLTTLRLRNTKVTDAGLKELTNLTNLTTLDLAGTRVTDEGLKELKTLKKLTTIHLHFTRVTDAGLKELENLPNLTNVCLYKTRVTNAGIKKLRPAQVPDLEIGEPTRGRCNSDCEPEKRRAGGRRETTSLVSRLPPARDHCPYRTVT